MMGSRSSIAIEHLGSSWFLLPQGTGILAVVLHQLDYQFHGLKTISVILWIINMVLLLLFSVTYLTRFAISPSTACRHILSDTTEAACLASISIAFTSALQMLAMVVVPSWGGHTWSLIVYVLWWINCGMAISSCLGLPLIFIHSIHEEGGFIKCLTPTTQLPLIAALTSAAGAGTLCQYAMLSASQQVPMIIVAYLEIGLGLPLALGLDVLFLACVLLPWQKRTGSEPLMEWQVYTDMVLCGPWGQSSYALQSLGMAILKLEDRLSRYAGSDSAVLLSNQAAGPIGYVSMFVGLIAWGQGTFWWVFAVSRISSHVFHCLKTKSPLPFGVPTWAIIFPWGVYTAAAVQLGKVMNSDAFKVWSTVLAVMLVIMWLLFAAFTIRGVILGTLLGHGKGWRPKANGE
ncbi:Sulfite efflux pump SSU1-like protein [Cladobotryum mycophilum]|uniref:Sulfite efflux pump SSU1-like protein n=1 Tax=Cladobotryum mycophilum TaxID=491253 RepID=A0ABR0SRP4_9HYPO